MYYRDEDEELENSKNIFERFRELIENNPEGVKKKIKGNFPVIGLIDLDLNLLYPYNDDEEINNDFSKGYKKILKNKNKK